MPESGNGDMSISSKPQAFWLGNKPGGAERDLPIHYFRAPSTAFDGMKPSVCRCVVEPLATIVVRLSRRIERI
jgi:hypothetical protein